MYCVFKILFLPKQYLERLSSIHKDFYGASESATDLSTEIVCGSRIPGCIAVLWHKKFDQLVMVRLDVDRAIGIEFSCGGKSSSF